MLKSHVRSIWKMPKVFRKHCGYCQDGIKFESQQWRFFTHGRTFKGKSQSQNPFFHAAFNQIHQPPPHPAPCILAYWLFILCLGYSILVWASHFDLWGVDIGILTCIYVLCFVIILEFSTFCIMSGSCNYSVKCYIASKGCVLLI